MFQQQCAELLVFQSEFDWIQEHADTPRKTGRPSRKLAREGTNLNSIVTPKVSMACSYTAGVQSAWSGVDT
jgi:hypothetical protein